MSYVLGLDTETTGLDIAKDRVWELGAVLYDWERGCPIRMFSTFLYASDYPEIGKKPDVSLDEIKRYGVVPSRAWNMLSQVALDAEVVIAHNGYEYDFPLLQNEFARAQVPFLTQQLMDTREDIPYPEHIKERKLMYLAADHGFINPFPHRALFDVLTMLTIARQYEYKTVMDLLKKPKVTVIACVSYKDKQKAKDAGFQWNGSQWTRRMTQDQADQSKSEWDFDVRLVG